MCSDSLCKRSFTGEWRCDEKDGPLRDDEMETGQTLADLGNGLGSGICFGESSSSILDLPAHRGSCQLQLVFIAGLEALQPLSDMSRHAVLP